MQKHFLCLFFVFVSFFSIAQPDSLFYNYSIDLNNTKNDLLDVKLVLPKIKENKIVFQFPAIVPGTYAIYNFGRFINDFKVYAKNGTQILVEKSDVNTYTFTNSDNIDYITYTVEDTWDTQQKKDFVFEPAGTNIQQKNNFVLNNQGFFGYIKNYQQLPIQLTVKKPQGFYASTGLSDIQSGTEMDIIKAKDYFELVDSPIMYCLPDTTTINIAETQVLVSVYSPSKKVSSQFIAAHIDTILNAQKMYLGGKLPVSKYAFIIYLTDSITGSGATGALEHSNSSFYVLMSMEAQYLAQMMKDVAAHEFFHIVTPLNIHSEEIGNFDFNHPKMSKHLWLYEGMTEYSAHHVQVKYGLIPIDQFLYVFQNKMEEAQRFYNDTLSFTFMSEHVLDSMYHDQYANVYAKGALIGMCLDILLRYYSNGKYGTQDLMADLSKKYGKNNSFKDELLFNEIEKLTFPEIRLFLEKFVAGTISLPFEEVFDKVGLTYKAKFQRTIYSIGGISIGINPKNDRIIIYDISEMNEFGDAMKYKEGDEIIEFNGQIITSSTAQNILTTYPETVKDGDKLIVKVIRRSKKGKEKIKILKAKQRKITFDVFNHLEVNKNASTKQIIARNAWLGITGD
jgi:predicted metalloprotease with PDZ domain